MGRNGRNLPACMAFVAPDGVNRRRKSVSNVVLAMLCGLVMVLTCSVTAPSAEGTEIVPQLTYRAMVQGRETTGVRAGEGETVTFRIHTKIPDYRAAGYAHYAFIVGVFSGDNFEFGELRSAKVNGKEMKNDDGTLFRYVHNGVPQFCFGRFISPNGLQDDYPTNIMADPTVFPVGASVDIEFTMKTTMFIGSGSPPGYFVGMAETCAYADYGKVSNTNTPGATVDKRAYSNYVQVHSVGFKVQAKQSNNSALKGATMRIYRQQDVAKSSPFYFRRPTVLAIASAGHGEVFGHYPTFEESDKYHFNNWSGPYSIYEKDGLPYMAASREREPDGSVDVPLDSMVFISGLAPGAYTAVIRKSGMATAEFTFTASTTWERGGRTTLTLTSNAGGRIDVDTSDWNPSLVFTDRAADASKEPKGTAAFTDVNSDTPHASDILWLSQEGISTGYDNSNGTKRFEGMTPVYRQDMAAFLRRTAQNAYVDDSTGWRITDSDTKRFKDVTNEWTPTPTPHNEDIWWLAHVGITTGYDDGTFRGMTPVYRQDMAAFLRRIAKLAGLDVTAPAVQPFTDVTKDTPHEEDIRWLASTGITTGYSDGTFRGMTPVYRQDMAAFLYRLYNLIKP